MRIRLVLAALLSVALTSAVSSADPKNTARTGKREIPKDPENKHGISPYIETIAKGDAAFVARDLSGAIGIYQDAIKLDADKMLGFYRLGEAMRESGKLDDADAAWQTALGKKGPDDLNARVLFVIADLRERQRKIQPAKDAWAAYAAFLQSHPKAAGYPATAADKQKIADRWMKLVVDYGVVKERIAKRVAEREAEAIENAKKDKLNR